MNFENIKEYFMQMVNNNTTLTNNSKLIAGSLSTLIGCYGLYKLVSYRRNRLVDDIENKAVFITGCDSGFGRALAKQLDELGCQVFAGCLTQNGATELKNETSPKLHTILLDLRSKESIQAAFEYVRDHLKPPIRLWGLVNNAGIFGPGGPVEFHTIEDYEEVMQVNFLGPVNMVLTFLPLLKKTKGRIVNVSSMVGLFNIPSVATSYGASKFAIYGFSEYLRLEKSTWGISVSTITPALYKTNILRQDLMEKKIYDRWEILPEETKQELGHNFPEKYLTTCINNLQPYSIENLSEVTDSIQHALFASQPKILYMCGLGGTIHYYLSMIPGRIFQRVEMRNLYGPDKPLTG